jgi:formate-dependent phosphoribosylglycinamide formyltransferase (GAR transformylase)
VGSEIIRNSEETTLNKIRVINKKVYTEELIEKELPVTKITIKQGMKREIYNPMIVMLFSNMAFKSWVKYSE